MRTRQGDSEATRQASAELQAIVGELEAIKARLGATEKRLRAAESTAAVVDVNTDGHSVTVEGWMADLIHDEVPEDLAELLQRIGDAANPDEVRVEIHTYLEQERRHEAKIAARRAAGK